jgi:uncharacterized protein (DUF983 family)
MVSECSNCGSSNIYTQKECSYCGTEFHFNRKSDNCVAGRKQVRYRTTYGGDEVRKGWLVKCPNCKEWLYHTGGTKPNREVRATEEYQRGMEIVETIKTGEY